LVKAPNINRNRNDYWLYVRSPSETEKNGSKFLLSGEVSDVAWLRNGTYLSMLEPLHGRNRLVIVNAETGSKRVILSGSQDIRTYSMDRAGDTVTYSIADADPAKSSSGAHSDEQVASGYRVSLGENAAAGYPTETLYVRHRIGKQAWGKAQRIAIQNPFTHQMSIHPAGLQYIRLSPDGKRLLLNYWTDGIPAEWGKNPFVQANLQEGGLQRIMVLYDIQKRRTTLAFKTVFPDSAPLWSADSTSFLINAHSPIGSTWEEEDIQDRRTSALDANLFKVDLGSGAIEEVFRHLPEHHEGPLHWCRNGDVIVATSGSSVGRLHHEAAAWRELERITLPHSDDERFSWLASDGKSIVGVHQAVSIPQNLFVYSPGQKELSMLTDLNPQLRAVAFAPVKMVHWNTEEGLELSGLLFIPPDYTAGKRYPLVIQTKGDQGWFTCDSGFNHDPAFAPQPMANAGMMYLIRTTKAGFNAQEEQAKQPKGYPGHFGEAAQEMDIWDSAVQYLDKQGLIDPKRVGIMGFSRTGFYVEFGLAHSRVRYAAASTADSAEYSLSEYWLIPTFSDDDEAMYGGPPYGAGFEAWKKYSISFNLEKIRTPLLMEEMGYGVHDDILASIPRNLAVHYEVLKGLTRLGKPVEMYYYPDEDHAPDHPKARLASLERNVDWYRFWLLGSEDPSQEKACQYIRWRKLRELHEADLMTGKGAPSR
jgi:dipeptidyl aminopeptidase/acylaminoacyl peptidase